jgi:ABC-type transporter Mla subunit MlaD
MVVTLDPGTPAGGPALAPGDVLPISRTAPDVNFEEFLSVLDADTRDYLVLLINGGGEGLARNGRTLAQVLRELDPFQRNVAKINQYLQKREKNIKRVTTSLSSLLNELGSRNTQLSAFVESSNGALKNFAAQKENIKQTIALLPGALTSTKAALNSVYKTSEISGPTLTNLLPAANGLADAQIASQALFNATENDPPHVISDQLIPFAKESVPALELLKSTTGNVVAAGPGLQKFGESLNYGVNELAADPAGDVPPYLFNLFWLGHNVNSTLGSQDAGGPLRQTTLLSSAGAWAFAYNIVGDVCAAGNPQLKTVLGLARAPRVGPGAICNVP